MMPSLDEIRRLKREQAETMRDVAHLVRRWAQEFRLTDPALFDEYGRIAYDIDGEAERVEGRR